MVTVRTNRNQLWVPMLISSVLFQTRPILTPEIVIQTRSTTECETHPRFYNSGTVPAINRTSTSHGVLFIHTIVRYKNPNASYLCPRSNRKDCGPARCLSRGICVWQAAFLACFRVTIKYCINPLLHHPIELSYTGRTLCKSVQQRFALVHVGYS